MISTVLFCSCDSTESGGLQCTVVKVSAGLGDDAHFYVHRDTHTLIEVGDHRIIVPGDLGEPGDEIELRNIPGASLYY